MVTKSVVLVTARERAHLVSFLIMEGFSADYPDFPESAYSACTRYGWHVVAFRTV